MSGGKWEGYTYSSWRRGGCRASRGVVSELMSLRSDADAQRAIDHASELYARMEARDAVPHARITKDVRDRITLVYKFTQTLSELLKVKAGSLAPTYDGERRRAGAPRGCQHAPNTPPGPGMRGRARGRGAHHGVWGCLLVHEAATIFCLR